jgi:hypothetical protein
MYVIQRIDNLGRGATFNVNASSGDYVQVFAGTLATSTAQAAPVSGRQSVTIYNPSATTAMQVKLAPASETTVANINDATKYPVYCEIPANGHLPFQIGTNIRPWVRSVSATTITGASAVEGL